MVTDYLKLKHINNLKDEHCTYASIKLEMSDSPPTPAAGPPTAFDIMPDILTTQKETEHESTQICPHIYHRILKKTSL